MPRWTLCCLLLILAGSLQSQRTVFRKYATNEYNKFIQADNEDYRAERSDLEQYIKRFTKNGSLESRTLPIVFHIMYTEDTTAALRQVASQINALNRDFAYCQVSRRHPRISNTRDNSQISFYPAATRNQALTGSGVSTVDDYGAWSSFDGMKNARSNGVTAWDTEKYINVWVVKMSGRLNSYAQFPLGPSTTDGIVIDYRFFGEGGTALAPYNEGKTLTHLIGSYLDLIELWGESRCSDDGVADTPIHNAPNRGSFETLYTLSGSGQVLLNDTPNISHISTCQGNPEEMVMNFMDATDDASQYMFTYGQIKRIHAVLSEHGPRASLSN